MLYLSIYLSMCLSIHPTKYIPVTVYQYFISYIYLRSSSFLLQCNNLLLLAVTKRNSNVALMLFFLYRLTTVRIVLNVYGCTEMHQTSLYYTILYNTILYCTYAILYYTILYYSIKYYTLLYCIILYYTILYYTILYYTILHNTILYYTIL